MPSATLADPVIIFPHDVLSEKTKKIKYTSSGRHIPLAVLLAIPSALLSRQLLQSRAQFS